MKDSKGEEPVGSGGWDLEATEATARQAARRGGGTGSGGIREADLSECRELETVPWGTEMLMPPEPLLHPQPEPALRQLFQGRLSQDCPSLQGAGRRPGRQRPALPAPAHPASLGLVSRQECSNFNV